MFCTVGSPPLARGTGGASQIREKHKGITPACAGNSCSSCDFSSAAKDHPRLRGEQIVFQALFDKFQGSPPLARGTAVKLCRTVCAAGITPACAGNSLNAAGLKTPPRDHPRLRGEQFAQLRNGAFFKGSPPLARGTVVHFRPAIGAVGITPACAGNSRRTVNVFGGKQDHPRLRGEQLFYFSTFQPFLGSPPLARGTDN